MSYKMPFPNDERLLYAAVASLPCQHNECGRYGVQVAHSNQLRDGKGRGIKAYPYRVAALCPECHYEIDQGKNMAKRERLKAFDEAHRATIGELFRRGLIRPVKEIP